MVPCLRAVAAKTAHLSPAKLWQNVGDFEKCVSFLRYTFVVDGSTQTHPDATAPLVACAICSSFQVVESARLPTFFLVCTPLPVQVQKREFHWEMLQRALLQKAGALSFVHPLLQTHLSNSPDVFSWLRSLADSSEKARRKEAWMYTLTNGRVGELRGPPWQVGTKRRNGTRIC